MWYSAVIALLRAEPDFELTSGPSLALLTFRYRPQGVPDSDLDALNARLVQAVNDHGRTYLTPTRLHGQGLSASRSARPTPSAATSRRPGRQSVRRCGFSRWSPPT